jgi:hypothetical protein
MLDQDSKSSVAENDLDLISISQVLGPQVWAWFTRRWASILPSEPHYRLQVLLQLCSVVARIELGAWHMGGKHWNRDAPHLQNKQTILKQGQAAHMCLKLF